MNVGTKNVYLIGYNETLNMGTSASPKYAFKNKVYPMLYENGSYKYNGRQVYVAPKRTMDIMLVYDGNSYYALKG